MRARTITTLAFLLWLFIAESSAAREETATSNPVLVVESSENTASDVTGQSESTLGPNASVEDLTAQLLSNQREFKEQLATTRSEIAKMQKQHSEWIKSIGPLKDAITEIGITSFDAASKIENSALAILTIVLTITGIGGFAVFQWMKKGLSNYATIEVDQKIKKSRKRLTQAVRNEMALICQQQESDLENTRVKLTEDLERSRLQVIASVYTNLSFEYWAQYKDINPKSVDGRAEFSRNLTLAISFAQKAIINATDFVAAGGAEHPLFTAKNNLVYHLAVEHSEFGTGNKREILKMASEVYLYGIRSRESGEDPKWFQHIETGMFATYKLGSESDKNVAIDALKSLINDPSLDAEWKEGLLKKYNGALAY